ncbi:MAG: hypothetical protein WD598_12085 [Acidimicrobiia bacterium]
MPTPTSAGEQPSAHAFDPLELPGVEKMKATARAGDRPRFTWAAVDDATEYTLVVQNLRGRPYWAWRGVETTVFLGGVDEPSDDAVGPVITKAAQWQVIAYAADGSIVGASLWRVVRPR